MRTEDLIKNISTFIRARYPAIAIETHEESRIIDLIMGIANNEHRTVYVYSNASGFRNAEYRLMNVTKPGWVQANTDPKSTENDDTPAILPLFDAFEYIRAKTFNETYLTSDNKSERSNGEIFIMLDVNHALNNDPVVQRKLRDIVPVLKGQRKIIILISPVVSIPYGLQKTIGVLEVSLPDKFEIEAVLCAAIKGMSDQEDIMRGQIDKTTDLKKRAVTKELLDCLLEKKKTLKDQVKLNKDAIVAATNGLTLEECENVFATCIIRGSIDEKAIYEMRTQITKQQSRVR